MAKLTPSKHKENSQQQNNCNKDSQVATVVEFRRKKVRTKIKMSANMDERSMRDLMKKVSDLKELCDVTLVAGIDNQR